MTDLHFVRFTKPQVFLDATEPWDHSFLNFTLGPVLESFEEAQVRIRNLTDASRFLFGVYKGQTLLVSFTKIDGDFGWSLSPFFTESEVTQEDRSNAISLLASGVAAAIDVQSVNAIIGPSEQVESFAASWSNELESKGLHMAPRSLSLGSFEGRIAYATLQTLPPPSPIYSSYTIELATPDDVQTLAHLYLEFLGGRDENRNTLAIGLQHMSTWIELGQIWVCRLDGAIAGYIATGRTTKRTVGIRNVFVSPQHRRKGVAEAMTRAVTRFMLGAEPLGFEGAPAGGPPLGIKEQICLNVIEEHVARLYQRCGFLLGEDDRDPVTGRPGWAPTSLRTIRLLNDQGDTH